MLRRIWTEDAVDHDGARFHYEQLRVRPHPLQQPFDVWLGGRAPGELRRVGRLADGWLASFSMPGECAEGRVAIDEAAAAQGRAIDPEHFGAMVFYSNGPVSEPVRQVIAARSPAIDPNDLVPGNLEALERRMREYIAVGFSKLVLVPLHSPDDWNAELELMARNLLSLQT